MIKVIDNVVPVEYQDYVEKVIGGMKFPWNYKIGATHSDGVDTIYGFVKILYFKFDDTIPEQKYIDLLSPIIHAAISQYNPRLKLKDVFRIRAGLFTKNQNDGREHVPHIDFENLTHHTILYYVNDSDGPTLLFDDDGNIIESCHPKKGRCIIFPGETMHSSAEPKHHPSRIVITYNILL
jgi:hypothetical protein